MDIAESVRWLAALTRHIQQAIGTGVRRELRTESHNVNTDGEIGANLAADMPATKGKQRGLYHACQ